jgi:TrkA domain protein
VAEIEETHLPGLGVRYEFRTSRGSRLGVVHHRTGRRELVVYHPEDPDTSRDVIALDPDDSATLAEMLGASRVAEHLDRLQQVEGLAIDWLPVSSASPFAASTIGDTRARTRTGTSVVAVIRGDRAHPAPGPEFRLEADDTLLVVGTPRGIEELSVILRTG